MLAGRPAEQSPRPIGGQLGVFQRRLQLRDLRLLRREIGLERAALELIELIAGLDLGAFVEQPLFQKRGDARDHVDPVDGLDPSEKFAGFGDRPLDRLDHANRRRRRRGRLGAGGRKRPAQMAPNAMTRTLRPTVILAMVHSLAPSSAIPN